MHLLFSRHGNTFDRGQKVVWVGSRNDLPLVESGRKQAEILAQSLSQRRIVPARIYCAPLQRTKEYAQIIIDQLGLSLQPLVDDRLSELDYGEWSGLSSEEIEQRFGKDVLDGWEKRSVWPKNCGWGGSEAEVLQQLKSLIAESSVGLSNNQTALFVTSNGRLRYLLKLVPGEFEIRLAQAAFKVKTGYVCLLENEGGHVSVAQWNISPADLRLKG